MNCSGHHNAAKSMTAARFAVMAIFSYYFELGDIRAKKKAKY